MTLSDWPSLRLVIPFAGGLILSDTIENTRAQMPVWVLLSVVVVLIAFVVIFSGRKPVVCGFCLSLSFFVAGVAAFRGQMARVKVEWPDRYVVYHGMVKSYPLERERTCRLEVTLSDSCCRGRNIYLYLPKDSASFRIEPGQNIVFDGKINKPSSQGVDFDYESYLLSHGISGTLRVQAKDWMIVPYYSRGTLITRSVRFRRSVIDKFQEWGLRGNALAVASAVSLGEKRALSDELREVYSTSGVSHVLAVSGLHVGIMCWFLYVFFPAFIFRKADWLRQFIVMGILWAYAFAIGFPVSITRSLIMFSIVAVCRASERENSALNSLGVAALVMLMINPSALFDMSFQLSFSAVLFIVLLTPVILDMYEPRWSPLLYIWRVSALSLSAQIGTMPLVMYHFSGFSTYVLLANLFVVPVMFVVVALSMSLWIVGWFPMLRTITVSVLTFIIDILNRFLSFVAELPYAHVELSLRHGWAVLIFYLVVVFLFLWIKEKRSGYLIKGLACITLACILDAIQCFVI